MLPCRRPFEMFFLYTETVLIGVLPMQKERGGSCVAEI